MPVKIITVAVSSIVIIFLPVALMGLLLSINEYRDQGIGGAADCNGPLTVMMFIVPALLVYAAGAIYYAWLFKYQKPSRWAALLLVLCLVMTIAAGRKAWAAHGEKNSLVYRETCGESW